MSFLTENELETIALNVVDDIIEALSSSPDGSFRIINILAKANAYGGTISVGLEVIRLDPTVSNGDDYAIVVGGVVVETATTVALSAAIITGIGAITFSAPGVVTALGVAVMAGIVVEYATDMVGDDFSNFVNSLLNNPSSSMILNSFGNETLNFIYPYGIGAEGFGDEASLIRSILEADPNTPYGNVGSTISFEYANSEPLKEFVIYDGGILQAVANLLGYSTEALFQPQTGLPQAPAFWTNGTTELTNKNLYYSNGTDSWIFARDEDRLAIQLDGDLLLGAAVEFHPSAILAGLAFQLGGSENNLIIGTDGDNIELNGGLGNDYIYGGNGKDKLIGGDGNDVLFGRGGINEIFGGIGDDIIHILSESNNWLFEGDGEGYDTVIIEDVNAVAVAFRRDGNDLQVFVDCNSFSPIFIIPNQYLDQNVRIENLILANGLTNTTIDLTQQLTYCTTISTPANYVTEAEAKFGTAKIKASPLVLDLNHSNTIDLISLANSKAYWDHNNDSFVEHTGWVQSGDGLLGLDINQNGKLDNSSELFGSVYTDGFTLLAQHDSNLDGIISSLDDVWDDLVVWQDTNQNGYSEVGEMYNLSHYNIVSINLAATLVNQTNQGNSVTHTSTFTVDDGATVKDYKVHDVWFTRDTVRLAISLRRAPV